MNMYYGLSVMTLRGDVSAEDYSEEAIADPKVLAPMPRIKISVDPEIECKGPAFRHAARITVQRTDGRTFTREILHRRGSPENPVNAEGVERKFDANVSRLLNIGAVDRLKHLAARLDALTDVKEISSTSSALPSSKKDCDWRSCRLRSTLSKRDFAGVSEQHRLNIRRNPHTPFAARGA